MDRQKIVVVQAHPDDELLWAWPVMQRLDLFDPILLLACRNAQKGTGPGIAARKLWNGKCDVDFGPLDSSNFYQMPTRYCDGPLLTVAADKIRATIGETLHLHGTDLVWTHNPVGEYGHGDHRLLWELVCTTPGVNRVLFSDICIKNKSHISYEGLPRLFGHLYAAMENNPWKHTVGDFLDKPQKLDLNWFNEGKKVYQDHRAWSWNNPVPETCNVYCIDL